MKVLMQKSSLKYHVMMILLSCEITDMNQCKAEIVQLAKMPVSIIIVGVGDNDFSKMSELDSEREVLRDENGVCANRDIV
jgi:hypothetical protein